jgi:tRNA U34 2-thiouridine synthase MnmA/TrmU
MAVRDALDEAVQMALSGCRTPQRAITPGQGAVFYSGVGVVVLGSGWIE